MTQLTQKTWTTKKEVTVENDSLLIKTKNVREDLEYRIKFEELGFDTVKKRVKSANIPFCAFILFDILYIGLLLSAVINKETLSKQLFWVGALVFFGIATIAAFYNRNKDVIYLTGGQKVLELLAARPDIQTVTAFIATIHQSMRQHYKKKYSKFDPDTTYEMKLYQLKWLKEINAITDKEYSEMLDNTKTENIIGFSRPNSEN
ncbi:hypothetical protein [Hymenobacter algoricola]|uniref:hypothetical protein n=1 Tax=Hymenobacter algoricola TaxID=486267 RepID=UPI0031E7F2FF